MQEGPVTPPRPLWVFGYGSLLWNPGFPVVEQRPARLTGYHRSFCMSSIHHRGSLKDPGLVLALEPRDDALCDGVAFRADDARFDETVQYLRDRELISSAYVEYVLPIELDSGETVDALAYVINTDHVQYVADMALEEQAQIIARSVGGRGPNTEYLWNTVDHLNAMGIHDDDLNWLNTRVREIVKPA